MTATDDPPNISLAVLLGNGVSIAANNELFIPTLTKEIRERFEKIDPKREAPDRVLARLAERGRQSGDPFKDFEAMIGPLDQQADNLHDLRELAELVGTESKPVRNALTTVETFIESLRRLGAGHALDIIAAKSIASYDRREVVEAFLSATIDSVGGRITIGNLNYDALALASILGPYQQQVCNMAWGYKSQLFDLLGNRINIAGYMLRTSTNDFPFDRRIRLVHPHGSLTWLRDPETGQDWSFSVEDLRMQDFWAAWRDGKTNWEPQVVLTNQSAKSELVKRAPFNLAYDVLYDRLVKAERWLIAGYSFRDECVNALLQRAWGTGRRSRTSWS